MSELFIRRPVMTTLVMFALLLFGILGLRQLPINALPNVDFPTLVVTAQLPGASPETMAAAVATPLEKQFATIAGITSMNSSSSIGVVQVTLQFTLTRNIDGAAQDVQAAITSAAPLLPPNMPSRPSYQKVNPAVQPVLYLAVTSDTLPMAAVDEFAEVYLAQHLSMINGVAQVQVLGQQKYAVRAQLNPSALAQRGIGIDDVATAMAAANVKQPTGTLNGNFLSYQIQSNDQLQNAAAYRSMVVTYRRGAAVRLGDLGVVLDGVQNDRVSAWVQHLSGPSTTASPRQAVLLAIQRQPGTNTVRVTDDIKQALPKLQSKIPASARVEILYDLSQSVRESVRDVQLTLLFTIVLVVGVVFFFLRNLSATLIASLALPTSIIGTFAAMSLLDFSLNNLTLMALTLSVGFVVDDAIVVLENIVRHSEAGEDYLTAARRGSREIGFTVVSMTLSLVAVFIPVLFMSGLIGRLFREFAITIGVAILVSGFVSLTLTPMLCSRYLRPHAKQGGLSERFLTGWLKLYEVTLNTVMRWRLAVLLLSFLLMGLTAWLFVLTPKGFLPAEDTGQVVAYTEASQSISYAAMLRHQSQLTEIIAADPNVESYVSSVGSGGAAATANQGQIQIYLKKRRQRALSADQVVSQLRPRLRTVAGIKVYIQVPPSINVGGFLSQSPYQYTLQSPDRQALYRATARLCERVSRIPGLVDVTTDLQISAPQLLVEVDRDKASLLGLDAALVDQSLQNAYGAQQASTIYTSNNEYWVIIEVAPQYYSRPDLMRLLYLRSSNGKLIPLDTVARLRSTTAPLVVNHLGQLPSATVSFNLIPEASLGTVLPQVEQAAAEILPASVSGTLAGTAEAFVSAFQGLWALLLLAVLVIYILLGILYESFIHPITILAGLPSAGLGALLTLLLFGIDLNVYAFLGLIMLIGIVKKNAIMMIDFALVEEREHGLAAEEAIVQACLVRFRPIMMTTMAALMGAVPIALGWGAGAESRQPLGLAIVGGLLVSQLITLYLTPVIYVYFDRLQRALGISQKTASQP